MAQDGVRGDGGSSALRCPECLGPVKKFGKEELLECTSCGKTIRQPLTDEDAAALAKGLLGVVEKLVDVVSYLVPGADRAPLSRERMTPLCRLAQLKRELKGLRKSEEAEVGGGG